MAHTEYEYEFMVALHNKLKARTDDGILLKVLNDDVLFIRIRHNDEPDWYMTYANFAQRIFDGWSAEEATNDIIKRYRSEVLKRYFK